MLCIRRDIGAINITIQIPRLKSDNNKPKTITGPMGILLNRENPTGQVVSKLTSFTNSISFYSDFQNIFYFSTTVVQMDTIFKILCTIIPQLIDR